MWFNIELRITRLQVSLDHKRPLSSQIFIVTAGYFNFCSLYHHLQRLGQ